MIDFIIKSSFSLSVFFIFYKLLLENEKMHLFNRFYLLITLVFSLVIPFITIQTVNEIPLQNFQTLIAEPIVIKQKESSFFQFNWTVLFFVCYGLVTLTFFIRFTKNVLNLLKKAKKIHSFISKTQKLFWWKKLLFRTLFSILFLSTNKILKTIKFKKNCFRTNLFTFIKSTL